MIGWNQLPYTSNKDVLSKQNPAARIGMGFGVDFLPFPGVAIWIVQFEVKGFLQCLGIKRKVRLENLKLLSSYKTWPALISTILSQVTTRKTYTHLFQDFTRSYQHQPWNPYAHLPLIVGYQKEATHSQMLSRCPKLQSSYTHPFQLAPSPLLSTSGINLRAIDTPSSLWTLSYLTHLCSPQQELFCHHCLDQALKCTSGLHWHFLRW